MKYFLHIGFDGSKYRGWQWQPNAVSVQEAIETALQNIFKEKIAVYGCGRTDACVHASQYVFHIELQKSFDFDLKFRLNKVLPAEIAIYEVLEVNDVCHARFDATSRTYDYFIHSYKDPFLTDYSSFYPLEGLDFDAMRQAVAILPLYTDFKGLCKKPLTKSGTLCKVTHAQIYLDESGQRFRFTITANRFLQGMVRLCVYFLLKIGNREMTFKEFEQMLANQVILPNKMPAFPNGLFLSNIEYPYLKLKKQVGLCSFLKVGLEG